MSKTFSCSQITKGKVERAEALVSKDAICFYLVEPETGIVKERNHDALGKCVAGKILIMPSGKGSSVVQLDGLYKLMMRGNAPAAIVVQEADTVLVAAVAAMETPMVHRVDPAFFRVYAFRFLEGNPFTEADLQSGIRTAVISDDLARRLFGTVEGAVGQSFSLSYVHYRVCGVVQGGSYLTPRSYAQVYLPYTLAPDYRRVRDPFHYIGSFQLTFLVKDDAQARALKAEVKDVTRRLNLEHEGQWKMELWEQPRTHALSAFQDYPAQDFSFWAKVRYFGLMLLVLLLVPALNLMGMISSRMESRLAEMGVRKSFGAGRGKLLGQVMWENLLLTLLGGLLGLIVAWLFIYVGREWVFTLLDDYPEAIPQGANAYVSGEMLFAPAVFACALLLCVVLNLLSALVPAWLSLRKPIVNSLYERR